MGGDRPLELRSLLLETAYNKCIYAGGCIKQEEDSKQYGNQAQGTPLIVARDI